MELEYIVKGIAEDFDKIKSDIMGTKPEDPYPDAAKEYNPETHRVVTDYMMRPDKIINIGTDEKPEQATVYATRIPIPFQQKIVRMRAAFLCGNPVELASKPKGDLEEGFLTVLKKTWDDNKLDYKNKALLKILMSEMEVAELWYPENAEPEYWDDTVNKGIGKRFRVRVMAKSLGDDLYPVYDEFGDLVSFSRGYVTIDAENKKSYHFDVYTAENTYYGTSKAGKYTVDKTEQNIFEKIQIIYGQQPLPEWAPVKRPINHYELAISDHTDSNGYSLDPLTVVKGKVLSYSKKGEKGGVLEIEGDGDISLLEAKQVTDSRELEQKNLRGHILSETSTPDISFEKMQGLGHFTEIALKMLFLDAHMAAADKEEIFGEYIQRRINFLKAAHIAINPALKPAKSLKITPKFEYYIPKDNGEKIANLKLANGGMPIMSQESSADQNPLVNDPESEWLLIKAEKQSELNDPNNIP